MWYMRPYQLLSVLAAGVSLAVGVHSALFPEKLMIKLKHPYFIDIGFLLPVPWLDPA